MIVPGLGGSGPAHWQTRWEALYPAHVRVEQRDWDHPRRAEWLAALASAVAGGPVVLVAHSLGCALVAHAAAEPWSAAVAAALLVAPADVDSPAHTPPETRDFAPLPLAPLPFPATVVASQDDPYVTLARARSLARAWGAALVDAGPRGHLNADSGLGDWPEGRRHLEALVARAPALALR
ncbi:MAG TPA: alpha/beta fold hydrolase [Polyangia bacterium]|nr:alpha/beta fold hydrolase [Polyangia bacterium]